MKSNFRKKGLFFLAIILAATIPVAGESPTTGDGQASSSMAPMNPWPKPGPMPTTARLPFTQLHAFSFDSDLFLTSSEVDSQ